LGSVIPVADDAMLTRAIVLWTGWESASWPQRDDDKLVAEYGKEVGLDLVRAVRRLKDDFYRSDARFTAADLIQMGDQAAAEFRARHPELGEDAVRALEWCYTFDYR
jgi:hypothetical protein